MGDLGSRRNELRSALHRRQHRVPVGVPSTPTSLSPHWRMRTALILDSVVGRRWTDQIAAGVVAIAALTKPAKPGQDEPPRETNGFATLAASPAKARRQHRSHLPSEPRHSRPGL